MEQILIALTTIPATLLSQMPQPGLRKWACWLGLVGEPFWFYSSWETGSWGILLTAIAVTGCWLVGVWNHWVRPRPAALRLSSREQQLIHMWRAIEARNARRNG